MRKILSGFLFRLLKGYEIWVLITLLLFASLYIDHSFLETYSFLELVRQKECIVYECSDFYEMSYDLYTHSIKDYRFETQGISAYDLYRYGAEALPEESAEKIINGKNCAYNELNVFVYMIVTSGSLPMFLMMFFIPVFFGRMFTDGTIKNYLAGGHSKGKLYLSSLVFTFCLDLFLVFVNLLVFAFWCIYYEWKPPFYLPVVIALFAATLLLLFTVTSMSLAILFLTTRQTVSLIVGFLVSIYCLLGSPTFGLWEKIYDTQSFNETGFEEYRDVFMSKGDAYFDQKLDLSEFAVRTYYKGRELVLINNSELEPVQKNTLLTVIYLNPLVVFDLTRAHIMSDIFNSTSLYEITPYMMCRDGLMAINIASNIFWISLMSGVVIIVNRKREVKA